MTCLRIFFIATVCVAISSTPVAAKWTRCLGPSGGVVNQLTVCPADPTTLLAASLEGLLKSTDAGSTWAFLGISLAEGEGSPFVRLTFVPSTRDHLYAGSLRSGLWESRDGAESWSHCLELAGEGSRILCVVIDPNDPLRLLVGTSGRGLFLSADGGISWRRPEGRWRHEGISDILPLMGEEELFLMGVWGEGLYLGHWGMESWERVGAELPLGHITVLRSTKTEDGLMVGTYGHGLYQGTSSGLFSSSLEADLPGYEITDLLVDPRNPAILYLSTDGAGIFYSSDGGQSWETFSEGLEHKHVYCLAGSPHWLYAGTCWGGIYRHSR
jgi:photosystem II stability/assembly factor-like uncharacterized protein